MNDALAALARINAAATATRDEAAYALRVGDRFTDRVEMPYRDKSGAQRTHLLVLLREVTAVDARGFEARTVEVVEERDRPSFAGDHTRGTKSCTWSGWDSAVARGDMARVA